MTFSRKFTILFFLIEFLFTVWLFLINTLKKLNGSAKAFKTEHVLYYRRWITWSSKRWDFPLRRSKKVKVKVSTRDSENNGCVFRLKKNEVNERAFRQCAKSWKVSCNAIFRSSVTRTFAMAFTRSSKTLYVW